MGAAIKDIMKSPAKKWILAAAVIAIVVGFIAWVITLQGGLLENSGMSNTFNWGLLIAVFAFLVGFGAGSQWVASYIVLYNKQELMRYLPVAQAIAVAGGCGAGVAILIDLGNPWHILAMITGPNPISPLTWDMLALTAFLIVVVIDLVAVARKSKHLKFWMILGCIAATALQVVEGLLFALMECRVWWASAIMPIDFLCVAAVCGLSIAAFYLAIKRRCYTASALRNVAKLLAWAIFIHIVLALLDFAGVAIDGSGLVSDGTAADAATMAALASVWWMYALELVLPIIAAIMLFVAAKKSESEVDAGFDGAAQSMPVATARLVGAGGILTIIGMFFHRLMLLYPAFGSPTLFVGLSNQPSPEWALPASTGLYIQVGSAFEIAQGYVPNIMEWISSLLPIGVFAFMVLLGVFAVELHRKMHNKAR